MPPEIDDVKLTTNPVDTASEKKDADNEMPAYMSRLDLDDEQKKAIITEVEGELKAIEQERSDLGVDELFDALKAQYEGELDLGLNTQFELSREITKQNVDDIATRIIQTLFEADPKFAVKNRPEFDITDENNETSERIEDFLDYKIDEVLNIKAPVELAVNSAVLNGVGILKIDHRIMREPSKRNESYDGTPIITDINGNGAHQGDIDEFRILHPELPVEENFTIENKGLKEFLENYPPERKDKIEGWDAYVKNLTAGKKINVTSEFTETTYNDPWFSYIDPKDFFVRTNTFGYQGLIDTRLIVEQKEYNWWELKKLEKKGWFYDIDLLMFDKPEQGKQSEKMKNHEFKTWNILECTLKTMNATTGDDEIKGVFWIDRKRKIMIGSQLYEYFSVKCNYIPLYIKMKRNSFYQPGIGEDLTNDSLTTDLFINFFLEALYIRNTVTPIVDKDSATAAQFIEKEFYHGLPIETDGGKPVDFLQKYMPALDSASLMAMLQYMQRIVEFKTKLTSGQSGRSDPIDPDAPASKTAMLLAESNVNFKAYILAIAIGFNMIAYVLMAMYDQISDEGQKFRVRPEKIVKGSNPFDQITRSEMSARVNIQTQAYTFALDKLNEKREFVLLYQMFRTEPLIAQNPMAVYYLLKVIFKSWNPKVRNQLEKLLPTPKEMQIKINQTAIQATAAYFDQRIKESQQAGVQLNLSEDDIMNISQIIGQATSEIATAPPPEEQKKRAKQAEKEQGGA